MANVNAQREPFGSPARSSPPFASPPHPAQEPHRSPAPQFTTTTTRPSNTSATNRFSWSTKAPSTLYAAPRLMACAIRISSAIPRARRRVEAVQRRLHGALTEDDVRRAGGDAACRAEPLRGRAASAARRPRRRGGGGRRRRRGGRRRRSSASARSGVRIAGGGRRPEAAGMSQSRRSAWSVAAMCSRHDGAGKGQRRAP